ncbi:MAG: hypothetical protein CEN89_328 [Candidatus Berkelbacteria bacterium Licking1014_7]|uniref:Uncharacterized protein n=1 Tax=Candidatus Berkelbacteria bacterium Licking1014_7 TaxID=2017147 RepID=A0A554LJA8_9BACT|nr:MAG: hypothetical protein CEN89_328 [Candidatus Berkelbacteria bacterium Licking1014_7]
MRTGTKKWVSFVDRCNDPDRPWFFLLWGVFIVSLTVICHTYPQLTNRIIMPILVISILTLSFIMFLLTIRVLLTPLEQHYGNAKIFTAELCIIFAISLALAIWLYDEPNFWKMCENIPAP